jgi:hypothetical protein
MRRTFGKTIFGAALAGLVFGAFAQPASAIEISKHAKDSAEVNAILVKGVINQGDTFELQAYIASLPKKPHIVIFLSSPGGNLAEGMKLGRFFYDRKIETAIETKTFCASACALAFLGGRDDSGKPLRTKAANSGLGFHSFTREFDKDKSYTAEDLKVVVQRTQSTVYVVADYLKAINTDMDIIRIMLKAQNSEMNFISNDDALTLNIRVFDEKRNAVVDPEQVLDRLNASKSAANRPAQNAPTAKAEGKSPT